jgi:3-phosphoglycerate kinase
LKSSEESGHPHHRGGMANTFLKARVYEVGKSLMRKEKVDLAKSLMIKAQTTGVRLLLRRCGGC